MNGTLIWREAVAWRVRRWSWILPLNVGLALAVGVRARSQEPAAPTPSVVDAARNARDQKSATANQSKVLTNDDFAPPAVVATGPANESVPPAKTEARESAAKTQSSEPAIETPSSNCDNPDGERLKAELQALQEERDQLRRELNADPQVISGGNVDLTNFKTGGSGVAFGSAPLSQTQPQSPARITEVELNEKIAVLERETKIACDPPKDAGIQKKLDEAEQQLKWLQREFALDRNTYYSKPNYVLDTAGKASLDAEQEQIDSIQNEIDRLKEELAQQRN